MIRCREMVVQTIREKIEGSTILKFTVSKVDVVDLRMLIDSIQLFYIVTFVYVNTKINLG